MDRQRAIRIVSKLFHHSFPEVGTSCLRGAEQKIDADDVEMIVTDIRSVKNLTKSVLNTLYT